MITEVIDKMLTVPTDIFECLQISAKNESKGCAAKASLTEASLKTYS